MPKLPENNKFDICMQYPKKGVTDEADFIHADKHEWFLQIDAMILMGMVEHSQSSESNKFASSKVSFHLITISQNFLNADKNQSFLQVDFNTLNIKVSYKVILSLLMAMIKSSQSTQSSIIVGIIVFEGSGQTCPKYPI